MTDKNQKVNGINLVFKFTNTEDCKLSTDLNNLLKQEKRKTALKLKK